ncbi:MAG: trypsin-like serine protease [Chitinivibrionales bacterium]|nr:trypsin-like serine protease [Chitinivibrionales bacterium]
MYTLCVAVRSAVVRHCRTWSVRLAVAALLLAAKSSASVRPAVANGIDLQQLNDKYRNAVVMVEFTTVSNRTATRLNPTKSENYYGRNDKGGHGSGFFISESEIVTNAHVVDDARRGSITVRSPATGSVRFTVEVVGLGDSRVLDLAVLRLPPDEQLRFRARAGLDRIPHLELGESDGLRQSEPLAILGFPKASDELKVIQAEVTGRQYQRYGAQDFMVPHQFVEVGPGGVVQPGNSGGPALDREGRVVGIPTLGDYQGNQGWLIPINLVKRFLPRLRENDQGRKARFPGA